MPAEEESERNEDCKGQGEAEDYAHQWHLHLQGASMESRKWKGENEGRNVWDEHMAVTLFEENGNRTCEYVIIKVSETACGQFRAVGSNAS